MRADLTGLRFIQSFNSPSLVFGAVYQHNQELLRKANPSHLPNQVRAACSVRMCSEPFRGSKECSDLSSTILTASLGVTKGACAETTQACCHYVCKICCNSTNKALLWSQGLIFAIIWEPGINLGDECHSEMGCYAFEKIRFASGIKSTSKGNVPFFFCESKFTFQQWIG